MIETALEVLTWLLLLVGSAAVLIGGIGVLRFPDVYTRMHAAGVTDTAGAGLILTGLMVHEGVTLVAAKLALTLLFLFFTNPTASFSLAHAAMTSGVEPVRKPGDEESKEEL